MMTYMRTGKAIVKISVRRLRNFRLSSMREVGEGEAAQRRHAAVEVDPRGGRSGRGHDRSPSEVRAAGPSEVSARKTLSRFCAVISTSRAAVWVSRCRATASESFVCRAMRSPLISTSSTPASAGEGDRVGAGERRVHDPARHEVLDLGGRPVGDDASAAHEHDAVGVLVGLLEVVRREQHGAAAGGVGADRGPEGAPALDIHARRRLVEDQQARVGQQRHREPQPLLLTARAQADAAVGDLGDAGALHDLGDGPGVGEQARGEFEGLLDRDVLEQAAGLQHGRDEAVRDRGARRLAEDARLRRSRGARARAACRSSWSCRRRSGRGTPRSRPAAR